MVLIILFSITLIFFGMFVSGFILYKHRKTKIKLHDKGNPTFPRLHRYLNEASVISYRAYLIFHICSFSVFFVLALYRISSFQLQPISQYLLLLIIALGSINSIIFIKVKIFRNNVLKDLFKVHEILFWQSKIRMPEDKSLAYASDLIHGPLKQHIIELSGCYRLKRDVIAKLAEIRRFCPIEELQAFTYMLEEKYKTGMTEDYHRTSMEILKRLRRVDKKIKKIANLQVLFSSAVVLFGLFFIIIGGPIIVQAYRQFTLIFN